MFFKFEYGGSYWKVFEDLGGMGVFLNLSVKEKERMGA